MACRLGRVVPQCCHTSNMRKKKNAANNAARETQKKNRKKTQAPFTSLTRHHENLQQQPSPQRFHVYLATRWELTLTVMGRNTFPHLSPNSTKPTTRAPSPMYNKTEINARLLSQLLQSCRLFSVFLQSFWSCFCRATRYFLALFLHNRAGHAHTTPQLSRIDRLLRHDRTARVVWAGLSPSSPPRHRKNQGETTHHKSHPVLNGLAWPASRFAQHNNQEPRST